MAIKKPKKPVAKTVQADEIRLLEDRAHVRLRPGMYIPNKDYCVYELVDNSVDEFVNGFGSMVELSINEEGEITVKDNGRGLPVADSQDVPGMSQAELALSRLKAGSKFIGEVRSAGLNGVGSSCINFLSEYFNVTIDQNGKQYYMTFKEGEIQDKLHEIGDSETHGTLIVCKPDKTIWDSYDDFNIS